MANNTIKSIQFKRGVKAALEFTLQGEKKPLAGEPCWESDTNKLKLGDGVHNYKDLPYLTGEEGDSGLVIVGYYKDNGFYEEESCLNILPKYRTKLYLDKFTEGVYYYSEDALYHRLIQECQVDDGKAGLVKLYSTCNGENTDGTVTQKAIYDTFNSFYYWLDDQDRLIAENSENISKNSENISKNSENISKNSENISINLEYIKKLYRTKVSVIARAPEEQLEFNIGDDLPNL